MSYIKGNLKKIIYQTDKGYIVGLFKVKETDSEELEFYVNHTIPFTGYFHELNDNDLYLMNGSLVEHAKYGEQFQVVSYERVMPEEKDAIVEFLSSDLFKGIGEKKAQKIVDYCGKATLSIIINNPNDLLLIPTITKKQVELLHNTLMEYESSYQTVLKLNELGFNTKDSLVIYNKYKNKTLDIVDRNIYLLMEEIDEIGYKKVDGIGLKLGIKRDDNRRIMAAILYVMSEVCILYGHTYLEREEIYQYMIRALGNEVANSEFLNALEELILNVKVIDKNGKYFLKELYEAEENIVNRLGYLSRKEDVINKKLNSYYKEVENNFLCQYNELQEKAIKDSMNKNFMIITGGPGTGKTTIIKAICELYKISNKLTHEELCNEIALLAPTGRASKRIAESTWIPATTIHRFLKWNKENNKFAINEFNKSNVKMVIVDEFSMVDTLLFHHLLNGLRYDTKIILVGDFHQLPSVGSGQLLKDMIESECLNYIELKELYRQSENSNIVSLAYQIKDDNIEPTIFNKEDDLLFIPTPASILKQRVVEIASQYKSDLNSFQVLAPMYKGINGIDLLNVDLQEVFNPKDKNKKEILINNVLFRENDKVIQLTNMPDDNVFNGDIGYIESIENNGNKKEIVINFMDNIVTYSSKDFNKFKHAYAISIHKSQGSEFDTVIIPLSKSYGKMLYKKLIYTAVTRARCKLYLIGEYDALEISAANSDNDIRKTDLLNKLKNNINV